MEFCINVYLLLFLENAFLRAHICREEAGSLDFTQNSSFPAKRHQRHAKVNFGDDGKHEISNRLQSFAVNAMLKVPNCEGLSPIFSEDRKPVVLSGRACRERMNGLISKYLVFLEFHFSRQKTSTLWGKLWPGWELNPRPSGLISAVPPTELQSQTGAGRGKWRC